MAKVEAKRKEIKKEKREGRNPMANAKYDNLKSKWSADGFFLLFCILCNFISWLEQSRDRKILVRSTREYEEKLALWEGKTSVKRNKSYKWDI